MKIVITAIRICILLLATDFLEQQWMLNYNYTVENSKLYIILPISFSRTNYCIELSDTMDKDDDSACTSYGAKPISNNKIAVCNLAINKSNGFPNVINDQNYKGNIFVIGF